MKLLAANTKHHSKEMIFSMLRRYRKCLLQSLIQTTRKEMVYNDFAWYSFDMEQTSLSFFDGQNH